MKTIKTTVYEFKELTDEKAKDRARNWFREGIFADDWYDSTYEDAKDIGLELQGFDIYHRTIEGKLLLEPETVCRKIIAEHGPATATYALATAYLAKPDPDEFTNGLLECYLTMLTDEMEYMESNEYVDEGIIINEYTFTEDGKRFG